MSILQRISALTERVNKITGIPPDFTAVFADGHRELISSGVDWFGHMAGIAINGGPCCVRFESDTDPRFAERETAFLQAVGLDNDCSSIWAGHSK